MEATLDWGAMARMTPPEASQPQFVGLVKRVWLFLYTHGGFWTAHELHASFGVPMQSLHTTLQDMADRGFVVRRKVEAAPEFELITSKPGPRPSVQYGVVKRCKVPRGVVIEEMWAVLEATARGRG